MSNALSLSVSKNKVMSSFVSDLCVDSLCSTYVSCCDLFEFCAYFSTSTRSRGVGSNDCELFIEAEHIESSLPLLLHFLSSLAMFKLEIRVIMIPFFRFQCQ